ncbi:MAG: putative transposase [Candidatus Scalindua rubra]|uniref:Putative transposase n=1 Tax=Candidatus Scalindua rubra TaxID=1872076 RepID=A0A1E3X628_9BACT|nr:MAG: putative transposase [Candidatus Scalindua rubra]
MYYVGVDLHKETSWFYIVDANGKKVDSRNISNKPEILKRYLKKIPKPFTLAVEATYNWYYFVDLAEQYAVKVFLANSYELKAFAKRHKKTDKIDARLIAQILQKGYLPVVTIADQHTRQVRELLRYRINLVTDRSRNIYRLKALLDKLGHNSSGDFTTYKRLNIIVIEKLPIIYADIVKNYIERIRDLTRKLSDIEKNIITISYKDPDMLNLMSLPGIGPFSAALIKSEIIDISRFVTFNRLCAYAGLAPRVSASANKTFHGPLNINRRKYLQWILLENVYHFISAIPEMQDKYTILKQRKGHNTAKVALAREMLKIIYHVLKERRPFYFDKKEPKIQSVAATALCGV